MKLNYFLKSFALVALMALVVNVNAKEITVAAGATDVEFARALEQAEHGDVILLNGLVTMNDQVFIEKNVTIKSADGGFAGFEGTGANRLLTLNPEPIDGTKLVFEGLDFFGGNAWGDAESEEGGAARINGGITEFIQCYFYENEAGRGGALAVNNHGTTVTFKGCEGEYNYAYGMGGEDSRGGFLHSGSEGDGEGVHLAFEYCKIQANMCIGGRGGAFCLLDPGTRRFYYTTIMSNKAGNWDEDGTMFLDFDENPISSDGMQPQGAAFCITGGATTFESCGIVNNLSWSHAPFMMAMGQTESCTFINTTITGHSVVNDGKAPLWTLAGGTFTFVNSIFAWNEGINSGNGGGFDANGNADVRLNIFNSIFSSNTLKSGEGAQDIRGFLNCGNQVTVKNSRIGLIMSMAPDNGEPTVSDNPNIPTKSMHDMYKMAPGDAACQDYPDYEDSGIDFGQGVRWTTDFEMPYFLQVPGSIITKLGDPALLADFDVDTDLFNQKRVPAADGSISAAPTLASVQDEFDDSGWEDNLTNIVRPEVALAKQNVRVICSSNGTLGVDFGDLKGKAQGTLVSITGQVVENVFNATVVSKGYYNINAAPGMYILKVEIGEKTYAQKLIVTN